MPVWHPLTRFFQRRRNLDCNQVVDLSSAYLEDEVSGSLRTRLQDHLQRCAPCRAFMDTLRSTLNALRSLPREEPPEDLEESIKQRLRETSSE